MVGEMAQRHAERIGCIYRAQWLIDVQQEANHGLHLLLEEEDEEVLLI